MQQQGLEMPRFQSQKSPWRPQARLNSLANPGEVQQECCCADQVQQKEKAKIVVRLTKIRGNSTLVACPAPDKHQIMTEEE